MDALSALAELQRAGFRLTISAAGISFYERAIGPFSVRVEHDAADKLAMGIAPARPPGRFRPWSRSLPSPAHLVDEALNFIRVFESSDFVGGD